MPVDHLTMEGLSKILLWGFPSTPVTILVRESKGPNQKEGTEKAAPPCSRESSHPYLLFIVTQGSREVIWISPFAEVS